jgi:transcriptional regulator NrdR family protein
MDYTSQITNLQKQIDTIYDKYGVFESYNAEDQKIVDGLKAQIKEKEKYTDGLDDEVSTKSDELDKQKEKEVEGSIILSELLKIDETKEHLQ